jgi:hypothetical protein
MAPSRAVAYEAGAQPVGRDGNKLSVGDESAISAPKARSRCRDAVYPSPLHPSKADIPNPTLCESGDRYFDLKLDFDSIKMEPLFKMNTINLASRIA